MHLVFAFQTLPLNVSRGRLTSGIGGARTATGQMYRDAIGIGTTKPNFEAAKARFEQSANQGDPNAELALFQMYDRGEGGPRDPVQAKKWADRFYANPEVVRERIKNQNEKEEIEFMRQMSIQGASGGVELLKLLNKSTEP
jgi:hypothetical protein